MEREIIKFLDKQIGVRSTAYIAKYCIFKDAYERNGMYQVYPNRSDVQRAYYKLKKLSNEGKIKYVPRGGWRSIEIKDML